MSLPSLTGRTGVGRRRISGAFRVLDAALDNVKMLVLEQHPSTFGRLFYLFAYTGQVNSRLLQSARELIVAMAIMLLGERHPIAMASALLQTLSGDETTMMIWGRLNGLLYDRLGSER